jgi:CRISPR/Cas system-associated exonuclease Cas4 (RecB family)
MIRDKITAADLMNYAYCPRIVYFTRVINLPQTKSAKQKKGLQKDRLFEKKTYRSKTIKDHDFGLNDLLRTLKVCPDGQICLRQSAVS